MADSRDADSKAAADQLADHPCAGERFSRTGRTLDGQNRLVEIPYLPVPRLTVARTWHPINVLTVTATTKRRRHPARRSVGGRNAEAIRPETGIYAAT